MKTTSVITGIISQLVAAIVALIVSFGVDLSVEQMAAIMGLTSAVGLVVTFVLWARTVDRAKVVEALIGDQVVAGEANDMIPNGSEVRIMPRRAAS